MSSIVEEGGGSCYFEGGDMVSVLRALSLQSQKKKTTIPTNDLVVFDGEEVESEKSNGSSRSEDEEGGRSCYFDGANMIDVIHTLSGHSLKHPTDTNNDVSTCQKTISRHAWSPDGECCETLTTVDESHAAGVIQSAWRKHNPSSGSHHHHYHHSPPIPSRIGLLTRHGTATIELPGDVLLTREEERAIIKMQHYLRRWLSKSHQRRSLPSEHSGIQVKGDSNVLTI